MNKELKLGLVGTSKKENEHRIPVHPDHFQWIEEGLRKRIFIEKGYGDRFNASNIEELVGGSLERKELFEKCDVILLPKPTKEDFEFFKEGKVIWGWPHFVQNEDITQVAIDKKMTFIAWEGMFEWKKGVAGLHTFHKNNELAGYCSVLHALTLKGRTGHYGPWEKVAVLSFGSVGRGAIHALKGLGYTDITLYTQRPPYAVSASIPSIKHRRYKSSGGEVIAISEDGIERAMKDELSDYDIIVNAILQDPDHPLIFIKNNDVGKYKPGTLIVDVSCDTGMGFEFAEPTSFENPMFEVGEISYYAVDHTPTYLWNSASYEISSAILPFIPVVMAGREVWDKNETIKNAIEINRGIIKNKKILSFQKREEIYPHKRM
jgi:alanine dehydrogenase